MLFLLFFPFFSFLKGSFGKMFLSLFWMKNVRFSSNVSSFFWVLLDEKWTEFVS